MKLVTEQDLVSAVPVIEPKVPMNRKQKLLRWAALVRASRESFFIYHNIEYLPQVQLALIDINAQFTAFGMATRDPVFQAEGLGAGANIPEIMKFMEISKEELHEFSCDCGGRITNGMMAERITNIAHNR
jgi:hypothetical protein